MTLLYPNGWDTVCSTKQCCPQYCTHVTNGWQKMESSCRTRRPCILQLSVCLSLHLSDWYLVLEDRKYKNSKINWWDNVYGFDMSCMKKVAVSEPLVDCCENHQVCCRSQKFIEFDLYKVTLFSSEHPSSPMPVSMKICLGEGRRSFIQRKNRDNSYSKRVYSWIISLLSMWIFQDQGTSSFQHWTVWWIYPLETNDILSPCKYQISIQNAVISIIFRITSQWVVEKKYKLNSQWNQMGKINATWIWTWK